MIGKIDSPKNNSIYSFVSISILLHVSIVGALFCGSLFSNRTIAIDGNDSIKAIMVDLSMVAAPEQALVEDTPQIQGVEETPIIDDQQVEITPEVVQEVEVEPDLIVEKEVIEKLEPPKDPVLTVKEEPVKPKEKVKKNPPVQKSSKQQVRQEVLADNIADNAVAPSISSNTQFSVKPTPVSRNYPEYPRRALDMRIEGHVVVLYDVNQYGRIENIRIIDAKPNNIFNRAVIQAMKQWKYQPIVAKDLTIKIVFNRNKSINLDGV